MTVGRIFDLKEQIGYQRMRTKLEIFLQALQMCLFLLGRLMDDLTWYQFDVHDQVETFEGVAVGCMVLCVVLQILRKHKEQGMFRILFLRSQLKFVISWSLVITIVVLFFNIFGCSHQTPEGEDASIFISYTGCCLNTTLIVLTNLNCSLICNTRADKPELFLYEAIMFGELIYNANLILVFISSLEHTAKDESILLVSLMIANQVLIMDLIFRAAYEDRQREEEKEERLLHGHLLQSQKTIDHLEHGIELTPH